MRPANLLVLARGFATAPRELLPAFEAQLSERDEPLAVVKSHEAASVVRLVQALQEHGARTPHYFEGFAFSFGIPQISSEFDLLRISQDAVVNIELKSVDVGLRRMEEQLRRNCHYLAPLGRTTFAFTFVADSGTLYGLDESGRARRADMRRLVEVLGRACEPYEGQVEDLFKVSNYLVSPLNDPQKFLEGRYFLTNHQAQIKAAFLKACTTGGSNANAPTAASARAVASARAATGAPTTMVYGSAGTGKSLLLYDIARSLKTERLVCVVHCGVLSEGHTALNQGQDGFRVISARRSERVTLDDFGAFLVDEAQRLWPSQLKRVVSTAVAHNVPLYLSLDRRQVLTRREDAYDVEKVVRDLCPALDVWELSRKIRTNRELTGFIRALFGLPGKGQLAHSSHVKVASAANANDAQELVNAFRTGGYQYIALDELPIAGCPEPGAVIGQEFDQVVMAVGPTFTLDDYAQRQLLYQGLTRARSHIALVVYQNPDLLCRLLEG